jgi:regulator of replication initiation timing
MPWKPAALSDLARENHALQMALLKLRRELENKQEAVGHLELLLHERLVKIDELNAKLEQQRQRNWHLEIQAECLCQMLADQSMASEQAQAQSQA